jgi:hypothetical protein
MNKFASDDVLEEFYSAMADQDHFRITQVHIPLSDVFYARAALEANTGVRYSLDRIERAMYVEGFLQAKDVHEPERVRQFDDGQEY